MECIVILSIISILISGESSKIIYTQVYGTFGYKPSDPCFRPPRQNLGSAGLNPINPYIFGKLVEILGSSLYFQKGRAHFGASGAKLTFFSKKF